MKKGVLLPLSWLYGALTKGRNYLYDHGIKASASFGLPVVSVGNLTVGGTGKTPLVEYLIRLLGASHRTALLSRGYKRLSRGFVLADKASTACDIGDEPLQIHRKFPDTAVAVHEKRAEGIRRLLQLRPETEVVVLDDAFQHRAVKPSLSVLAIDYRRPVFDDWLLPAGSLRESRQGMKRADIVVVTKCPENLGDEERKAFIARLQSEKRQQVFFSHIAYTAVCPAFPGENRPARIDPMDLKDSGRPLLAFCGIGAPQPFAEYVRQLDKQAEVISFPDHHRYTGGDLERIAKAARSAGGQDALILTTEKDCCRLAHLPAARQLADNLYYLAMEMRFCTEQEETLFNQLITEHVRTFSPSC